MEVETKAKATNGSGFYDDNRTLKTRGVRLNFTYFLFVSLPKGTNEQISDIYCEQKYGGRGMRDLLKIVTLTYYILKALGLTLNIEQSKGNYEQSTHLK